MRIRPFTREDTIALMDLKTGIDILHDLQKITSDLNAWYQQYKYVTIYGDVPDMPLFKGMFVNILVQLNIYNQDAKVAETYFREALKKYGTPQETTMTINKAI